MVQEYQSPVRVYEHAFEVVMAAYEKRFPTCPMIPAFLGSETLSEHKSEDGAIHIIERKCKLNVDAPYLLKKITGVDYAYFIQRNSLNRRDRTLKIEAWNDSFSSRVAVKEHCYYSVHPDNPDWTMFEQDASLDVKSFFGFEAAVEKLAIKAYTTNLKKGKEIIMYYINQLKDEGVTSLPRFESSVGRPRCISHAEKQDSIETSEQVLELEDIQENKSAGVATQNEPTSLARQISIDVVEPPPMQEYKLEDSFIKRTLGDLTMIEESTLMKLRRKLAASHQGKMPNDAVLLRFLRARDCNSDKAFEMLKNSLHWRRQHHVDSILSTWNPPELLLPYYPGGWHHYDKDGRPVYIIRLGSLDIKGLLKSVGAEGFVKQVVSINEEGLLRCKQASAVFEKPITSWVCLCDLEGLSMRHLWRPGIRALLNIIEVVEANYPETIGRLLIVRAPRVFGVVWTLLSPFIDENSRKKFMIYSGNDYQGPGGLTDYIPGDYIPHFLNGPCDCDIVEGSTVPKSFYKHQHMPLDGTELSWLGTDLYHNASVMKGSALDVLVTVQEPEAVITWDFDIIEGDVMFSVLRHKRPREVSTIANTVTCLGETATPKIPLIRPGIDAAVVEKPIIAGPGESVQGTHICQQTGVYVLQWKFANSAQTQRSAARMPHKAKIMYYHEVLPSKEFRGSMSSLESSQSGFSQLSGSTLASGTNTSVVSR